jgi:hypothetical protein
VKQQITLEVPAGVEFEQAELEILKRGWTLFVTELGSFRRADGSGSANLAVNTAYGKLRGCRVLKETDVRSDRP